MTITEARIVADTHQIFRLTVTYDDGTVTTSIYARPTDALAMQRMAERMSPCSAVVDILPVCTCGYWACEGC